MVDGVGTRAAIRAGFSKTCASRRSAILLKDPLVQAKLDSLREEQYKRLEITSDKILDEIRVVAYTSLDTINGDGGEDTKRETPVRMEHKLRALELLGKHKRLFVDKVETTIKREDLKEITADMTPEEASQIYMDSLKHVN
jgi:phage terminase small subunit